MEFVCEPAVPPRDLPRDPGTPSDPLGDPLRDPLGDPPGDPVEGPPGDSWGDPSGDHPGHPPRDATERLLERGSYFGAAKTEKTLDQTTVQR